MNELTSKMYFKTLSIVHTALVLSLMFSSAAAHLKSYGTPMVADAQLAGFLLNIVPLAALGCITAAFIVFNNKMKEIKELGNLADKLTVYRSAHIVRLAVLEFPGILAVVSYLLTGRKDFLAITALIFVIFLFIWPRVSKAISDMGLDITESAMVRDPDTVIIN